MPARIIALTKKFLRDPVHVTIESKQRTLDTTNQTYYEVPNGKKREALARVLDMALVSPDAEAQLLRREAIRVQLRHMEMRRRELLVYAEVYEPALVCSIPNMAVTNSFERIESRSDRGCSNDSKFAYIPAVVK